MFSVSHLYIYPVKALGGISVESAALTDRGLQYDRRFMLIDDNNRFLSQRELANMALLRTMICDNMLRVYEKNNADEVLELDLEPSTRNNEMLEVQMFDDKCFAYIVSDKANNWFSSKLGINARLVYMPDSVKRNVDEKYAIKDDLTSFSDCFPLLMIGQRSLDDLNGRLAQPLLMNRFRPNIVFSGGVPFEEDTMNEFEINGICFYAVKPCARCVVTTIEQETGTKNKEPLATLSRYRMLDNKIYFGQNILFNNRGSIAVGNRIKVLKHQPHLF